MQTFCPTQCILSCGWLIGSPQGCVNPNLRTCEHVTLRGQKDFAGVTKVFGMWRLSWMRCGGGLYVITEYLQMKMGRGGLGRMEDAIQLALEEEEGPSSQGRQAGSLCTLEKARERSPPRASGRSAVLITP